MAVNLAKIVCEATPTSGVQLRTKPYGKNSIRQFLRDVLAIANAAVEGARNIIVGVDIDKRGIKQLASVNQDDFSGTPSYEGLVTEFIEPPLRMTYQPIIVDGARLGVFEISDCQDQPYMMRIDFSEELRRGDAYVRVDNAAIKMGRRQLQDMFTRNLRDSVSADQVEVGFPGEIIHKTLKVPTVDLAQMPSTVARMKLKELFDIQSKSKNTGATTGLVRLAHARLYGSDNPYETWTPGNLIEEMSKVEEKHQLDDLHFLFESNAQNLQIVVYNQGGEPIKDASLLIVMPSHNAFYVADRLPKLQRNGAYVDRQPAETANYPAVRMTDGAIQASKAFGEIPPFSPVTVFKVPVRICVGSDLRGRKLGLRYSLFGSNLRRPAKGKLRLQF